MKKRADGLYCYQLYLGTKDGKRKYKSFYGKTQKEARQKAEDYKNNKPVLNLSLNAICERFLAIYSSGNTLSAYKTKSARIGYFCAEIGNYNINDILPEDIQRLINRLAVCNPYTNKPTARRTLTRYLDSLSQIFVYAQKNRLCATNPCEYVNIPSAPKKERDALSVADRAELEACKNERSWIAVFLMYTGLRRGEATALLWSDVDLKNKTISVSKSYDFKECRIKPPKTEAGNRLVPIPDRLIPILKAQKSKGLVIKSYHGQPMTNSAWRRLNERLAIDSGVSFEWHQLRHTFASVLYSAGVDVLTACKILGHSDVKTTMSIYTHLEESKRQLSIDKLNEYLG